MSPGIAGLQVDGRVGRGLGASVLVRDCTHKQFGFSGATVVSSGTPLCETRFGFHLVGSHAGMFTSEEPEMLRGKFTRSGRASPGSGELLTSTITFLVVSIAGWKRFFPG